MRKSGRRERSIWEACMALIINRGMVLTTMYMEPMHGAEGTL